MEDIAIRIIEICRNICVYIAIIAEGYRFIKVLQDFQTVRAFAVSRAIDEKRGEAHLDLFNLKISEKILCYFFLTTYDILFKSCESPPMLKCVPPFSLIAFCVSFDESFW